MAISRRDRERNDKAIDLVVEPDAVMIRYPTLWEFLTNVAFDDGSARALPTLTLFVDGRVLKACLNDKAEGMVAFAAGSTFTAILEALEEGLNGDCLDWRRPQNQPRKK